jgi:two-component system, OmpR family, phosphate regulon sensor histidine kinase PhoR
LGIGFPWNAFNNDDNVHPTIDIDENSLCLFTHTDAKSTSHEGTHFMREAELAGVFEALTLPAFIANRQAQMLISNRAAKLSFGDMMEGTPLYLKFRLPEMRNAFERVMKTGAPVHFEYHERVPIERWFRVDVSPLIDVVSNITGCLFLFRDTSESRNIERMRTDFVANASHELRTPLASLTGFIETLRGPARDDTKAREHFLSIMQVQASRMSRLIDDLLSLSRLEMRPFADLSHAVDLALIAKQVIDTLGPVSQDSGVEIIADLPKATFIINGIRDELIEVMENLIENACKYGRSGKRVIVSLKHGSGIDEGSILLGVQDFGPGIAQEHIPRLTERFYRADSGHDPAQKGTGLGLAIVKHILSRHQSRLSIRSHIGKGSQFIAHFPVSNPVK